MTTCTIKCYDSEANRLWKSKPIELLSERYFRAITEAKNIIGADRIWVKWKNENGITQTVEIKFNTQKQTTGSICYHGSDGETIYGISITKYLNNIEYRNFINQL